MWFTHPAFQILFQAGVALLGAWLGARLSRRLVRAGEPMPDPAVMVAVGGRPDVVTSPAPPADEVDLTDDPVALGSLVFAAVVVAGWLLVQLRPWLLVMVVTASSLAAGAAFGVVRRRDDWMPPVWTRWWAGLVALTIGAGLVGAYQLFAPIADPLGVRRRWEELRDTADSGITALVSEGVDVVVFVAVQFLGVVVLVLGLLFVAGAAAGLLVYVRSLSQGRGVVPRFAMGTQQVWARPDVLFMLAAGVSAIGLLMVSGLAQAMFVALGN